MTNLTVFRFRAVFSMRSAPHHPNVIRNASGHCWRDPQRPVNPAEIVMSEVERQCRFQIVPLFRERISQPAAWSFGTRTCGTCPLQWGRFVPAEEILDGSEPLRDPGTGIEKLSYRTKRTEIDLDTCSA